MKERYLFENPQEVLKHVGKGGILPTLEKSDFHFIDPERVVMILNIGEMFSNPTKRVIAVEMTADTAKKIELDVKKFRDRYKETLKD